MTDAGLGYGTSSFDMMNSVALAYFSDFETPLISRWHSCFSRSRKVKLLKRRPNAAANRSKRGCPTYRIPSRSGPFAGNHRVSILRVKSCAKRAENPKSEFRNPKQIQNPNLKCQKPGRFEPLLGICALKLFRISDFVLRIWFRLRRVRIPLEEMAA